MLKEKLRSGKLTVGSWVMMRDPISVDAMAAGGLDWLTIDLEHAPISIETAADLIRVGLRNGVDMLVRMADHNTTTVKQVLDAGASGVIVPDIRHAAAAEHILSYMRYPAKQGSGNVSGNRGAGLACAHGYGRFFDEYYDRWNKDAVFIAQIEHIDALDVVDEIATTDGVDCLFVGPYDLSASMGKAGQLDDAEVIDAIQKIFSAAKAAGKVAGIHSVPSDVNYAIEKIETGAKFLAVSSDVFFIRDQVDALVAELKKIDR